MYTTDGIEGYLKRMLVGKFTQAAGKSEESPSPTWPGTTACSKNVVKGDIAEEFKKLGLLLTSFVIENISLPPEIEKALDAAAAQSARSIDNTLAWEGMQAMRDAAKQPGGGSGVMQAGMGMGMGMGMGNMMGNVMAGAMPGYPQGYPPQGYPPPDTRLPATRQGQPQAQQPAAEDNSLEAKLRKLKAALDAGLLTDDEYKAKRAKMLDAF